MQFVTHSKDHITSIIGVNVSAGAAFIRKPVDTTCFDPFHQPNGKNMAFNTVVVVNAIQALFLEIVKSLRRRAWNAASKNKEWLC